MKEYGRTFPVTGTTPTGQSSLTFLQYENPGKKGAKNILLFSCTFPR
jgi:hypothetical protein